MTIRTSNRSSRYLATALACSAVFSFQAATAAPQSDDGVIKQTVSYSDLNLQSPAGVAALFHRISRAAEAVCTPFESRELSRQSKWRACFNESISRAVAAVAVPSLTAYADAKLGRPASEVLASR
jgi:UrcA family protein